MTAFPLSLSSWSVVTNACNWARICEDGVPPAYLRHPGTRVTIPATPGTHKQALRVTFRPGHQSHCLCMTASHNRRSDILHAYARQRTFSTNSIVSSGTTPAISTTAFTLTRPWLSVWADCGPKGIRTVVGTSVNRTRLQVRDGLPEVPAAHLHQRLQGLVGATAVTATQTA